MTIFSASELPDQQESQQPVAAPTNAGYNSKPDTSKDYTGMFTGGNPALLPILAGLANAVPGAKQLGAATNAGVSKVWDYATGKKQNADDTYSGRLDAENMAQDNARRDNPGAYYTSNIAASIPLYAGAAGLTKGAIASMPITSRMIGAGLFGGAEGGSQSSARGNDFGTVMGDTATGSALAILGEGIGGQIMKGLGTYAGHGSKMIAADAAADAAARRAGGATKVMRMNPDQMGVDTPEARDDIAEEAQKVRDAADASKATADAERQATISDIQKGPIANVLGYGGTAFATHLLGGGAPEDLLTALVGGNSIKNKAVEYATPALIGGAKGASMVADKLPSGSGNVATGGFDSVMQYLNQPIDERQQDYNAQMTSPSARANANDDNPLNRN